MTSQRLEVEQSDGTVEPVGSESRPRRSRSPLLVTVTRALKLGRTRVGLALVVLLVGIAVFGPDTLSRFLSGGRSVLILSLLATILGLVAGVGIGLVAAYSRSSMDDVIMRSMDILLAFPQIVFVLLLVSTIGPKLWLLVLTVAATHAP